MKKNSCIVLGMALSLVTIVACNSNKLGSGSSSDSTGGAPIVASAQQDSLGHKLLVTNDCLTCHKVDAKVIGPSYQDVANKYTATPAVVDTLAKKIINGGKGNWGEIAMSPHPALSMDDARALVFYILSLKK
jgi:cytochrome c